MEAAAGRRPARARKAVTHYSDDNPSTFTVKRGKNDHASDPPEPLVLTQQARAKRRDKRAAARPSSSTSFHSRRGTPAASTSAAALLTTPWGSSPNTRTKSGAPSSASRRSYSQSTVAATAVAAATSTSSTTTSTGAQGSDTLASPSTSSKRKRPREQDTGPPPKDKMLAHRVTIQPVLKPKGAGHQASQSLASARKTHAATRTPLQQLAAHARWHWPTPRPHGWKTLPTADKEHTLWAPNNEPISLPPAAITAMTQHDPQSPYWMAGDAAGKVICFDLRIGRPVRTLHTRASQREDKRFMTSKTVVSYPNLIAAIAARKDTVVVWTAQELQAIRISTAETLWTTHLDCQEGPTASHREQVTAAAAATQCLDIHDTQNKLLWQKPTAITTKKQQLPDAAATLYLGVWGKRDIHSKSMSTDSSACDVSDDSDTELQWTALIPHDTSHAVVWDMHNPDALLQVATTLNDEAWELRRIHVHNQSILDKTILHNLNSSSGTYHSSGNNNSTTASGSGGGTSHHLYTGCRIVQADDYLFLCTNRGIRCFDAQRFTFLTVYGETVALHGKTVGWQDCFWMPEPSWPHTVWQDARGSTTGSTAKTTLASLAKAGGGTVALATGAVTQPTCLLSTRDEVARRHAVKTALAKTTENAAGSDNGSSSAARPTNSKPTSLTSAGHANALFSNMLLVGVPHPHRGPTELQSTLYVWKPGQVLPLTTLQAPAGGLLGLVARASPTHGWQLTCATAAHGQAWEFRARLQSDFSGNMYPVHYHVVNDNVEYIEDEDELDKTNAFTSAPHSEMVMTSSSSMDLEKDEEAVLQRALKESLDNGVKINVLLEHESEENNPFCSFVPAWPDLSLRPMSSLAGGKVSLASPNQHQQQLRSPSRFREAASVPELFAGFPQLRLVYDARRDAREIGSRRNSALSSSTNGTPPPDSTSASSVLGDPFEVDKIQKAKAKRSRATNVEVLLQASVDPKLRQEMMERHKQWSDGRGSRFCIPAVDVRGATKSKQDAAMKVSLSSHENINGSSPQLPDGVLKEPPAPNRVTSASHTVTGIADADGITLASPLEGGRLSSSLACAACAGRMVIHSCGKRAKPVDHEALAKAEAERKEAEEAEKQRIKTEKRRAAEAKRREARKKKKEEDERKRREEELQKLEEERVAALQNTAGPLAVQHDVEAYQHQSYGPPPRKIPRYAELMSAPVTGRSENDYSFGFARELESAQPVTSSMAAAVTTTVAPQSNVPKETYARQNSSNASEEGHSVYSSTSFTPAAVEPLFKPEETTPLEDTNTMAYRSTVPPPPSYAASTEFSERTSAENDALAMLAGLADQSAKAPFVSDETMDPRTYDYSGAADRRRAILDQFHHSIHPQSSTITGGNAAPSSNFSGSSSVYDRPSSQSVYGSHHYTSGTAAGGQRAEAGLLPHQSSVPTGGSSTGSLLHYNHKPRPDDSR